MCLLLHPPTPGYIAVALTILCFAISLENQNVALSVSLEEEGEEGHFRAQHGLFGSWASRKSNRLHQKHCYELFISSQIACRPELHCFNIFHYRGILMTYSVLLKNNIAFCGNFKDYSQMH